MLVEFEYMKKTFISLISFGAAAFLASFTSVSAQAVFGPGTTGSVTFCTADAYVCPNGTTVGRTGSNCQFVCPDVVTTSPTCTNVYPYYCTGLVSPSYSYTSGCYTYYYNGYTRTTTVQSYNCQTNNYGYYPVATTYTYPSSGYSTYHYCNGSWHTSYHGGNNCISNWLNYNNYNQYQYNNYQYRNNCYYLDGRLVCQ